MAEVSAAHTDVGTELRRLAQAILDGIDPGVRAAATLATSAASGAGPGKCQQVWCPVCALAAVVSGEQHPLVAVIADHSVALLEVIRNIVDDIDKAAPPSPAEDPSGGGENTEPTTSDSNGASTDDSSGNGAAKTRYQAIPVTLQE